MTEQEQKDLDEMKAAITKEKTYCFDNCVSFLKMSPSDLACAGHKTIENAITWTIKNGEKKVAALTQAYTKKYPD